ncbi:YybS family protein [Bacillus bingmayongensis]|uniref:YybS family protein n=1 Tax=Bacillus bingmayongensis TaxID=1150157 RepID=UPI0002E8FDEC|nr:YybS family protein [Bacillus bingmayongensis]
MKRTRLITEGSILLAVYAVLLLISLYIPIVSIVAIFALPLPFLLFMVRYPFSSTCMLFAAALFVTIIVSSPLSLVNTCMSGIIGVALGYMYKKKKGPVEILLVGMLAYLFSFVLIYVVSIKLLNIDLIKQMQDMLKEGMEQSEKIMKATGAPISKEQKDLFGQFSDIIWMLLPSLLVMVSLIFSWLTVLMAGNVLRRLKYTVTPWSKFRDMQLPKNIVWYYVIFILLSTFIKVESGSYLDMAFTNLYTIFSLLLVFQGFSCIAFFAHIKGYTKAIPIISFVLVMIVPILFPLVTILGIIDLGFSLRSKIQSK